ncbi:MAG: endonuclease/exonuclease/phosphatase family protein [Candidatus Krumholzibacteriia bacterium]
MLHRALAPRLLIAAALALALCPATVPAESMPVFLDGFFAEWAGPVELTDPAGDGGGTGIDFRQVDVANDDDWLFIRFQVTTEVGIQDGSNNIVLYMDTDVNASTGRSISGIGAELEWRFGDRSGDFYRGGGSTFLRQDDVRLRQLPSVTSSEFEIAIGRDVKPDGSNLLFTGNTIRVLLRDEGGGDQAPDVGPSLSYTFDAAAVGPPSPTVLARDNVSDVRAVTWNVRDLEKNGGGWDNGVTPSADRVFSALDPDVICFQEIYDNNASETAALVESFLPSGAGEAWYAAETFDCKVVSRFPILGSWSLDGNVAVHLDATAALGRDLLVVNAHLPCCTNDSGRQREADNIMSFCRDAMTPGGSVDVPSGTGFLITGDLNLVGDSQQLTTLLTGDIIDEGTFGPDFDPDWDGTALADVVSRQTEARFAYTWRNDFSSFAPGRLDFIIYNDSALEPGNHFSVYTPEMSASELSQYGLQAADVTTVSDHLPHVADFRESLPSDVGPGAGGGGDRHGLRILGGPGGRGEVSFTVQLEHAAHVGIELFDVRGKRVAVLRRASGAVLPAGLHPFVWDGRTPTGTRAASGTYIVRVVSSAAGVERSASRKLVLLR